MRATLSEACNALLIERSVLWSLHKNELESGRHWVYLTGEEIGCFWMGNPAIADLQREQTAGIAQAVKNKAAAIETFRKTTDQEAKSPVSDGAK